jgi:hypothetical protein
MVEKEIAATMKSYEQAKGQLASGGVADVFDEGDMQTLR